MLNIIQNDFDQLLGKLGKQSNLFGLQGDYVRRIAEQFFSYYIQELANSDKNNVINSNNNSEDHILRNSLKISYSKIGTRFVATVGFDNPKAGMVSKVQEYGTIITVTPKMRVFLATAGMPLRDETTHIEIPGRQPFRKAIARARADFKQMFKKI